ncbi:MAG: hypothetical protein NPINA01_11920 [Nitrospinaceae bacterium]|nr:MAG: hypothetical protein NPINA01_11920 [Nitrospinaceae bacterium]
MTEFDPATKVARSNPVNNSPKRYVAAQTEASQSAETIDRVTLSHKPETAKPRTSGEIRHQLVSKFRDILEQGTYKVKANEIADKMVQKIREQKNRTII